MIELLDKTKNYIGSIVEIVEHTHKSLYGVKAIILAQEVNENNHLIFALDIPHPEDENAKLWVNEMDIKLLDLFEHIDLLPLSVRDILGKHLNNWVDDYDHCSMLVADLEVVGYTCDYYLDGVPFNLTKINLDIK